ncbi:OmpW family outer membrane protein [Congregibacter brevis]|uniref:OmpW family outer membrane protein n=1 Tax=Congregibacter brevis TaxID=3081201 RepID=A0ABZ0I9D2_9GAMM|nr:OmpW family outer membrane protein [Congregibacter sp. IMCC45268]
MRKQLVLAMAAGLGLASLGAQAYEQGDIVFRAGIATVAPSGDSDAIELPTDPPTILPGGVDVDNGTAISLIATWMMSDNWGLELLAATPFKHDIDLADLPVAAGSTKHLPPTVSIQWYPRGGMDGWQPYLGLGVNYTTFFSEDVDSELGAVLGDLLDVTSAKLSLDDSVGLAAQAGVDIPLTDEWALNLGVWYIDLGTTADIDVVTGGGANATVSFDVDIDPWVYNIGVAYKF